MQPKFVWPARAVILTLLGLLTASPVLADKPAGVGGGNSKHQERDHGGGKDKNKDKDKARGDAHSGGNRQAGGDGRRDRAGPHFDERQQGLAHEYYAQERRAGRCPPGLAKKQNGCMPPGQAKKWQKGRPLPREVVFHELPTRLSEHLGPPPDGHRFVRVASDILLIAIGTGMVMDAIEDLGRM